VDAEEAAERFWILNGSNLARTYPPHGKVRAFFLGLGAGESASFEQVCAAVLATMVPDLLSPERREARTPLDAAVQVVLSAQRISRFVRFCVSAEERRVEAGEARSRRWRQWALEMLREKRGMICAMTAMGFGTWVEVKPRQAEPEKMEAEVELETVDRLILETRESLKASKKAGGELETLRATLENLRGRRAKVQSRVDKIAAEREAKRREEEELKAKMHVRVRSLCGKGERVLEDAEELLLSVLVHTGPVSSDTHIDGCYEVAADVGQLIDEAEDIVAQAVQAGSYYDIRAEADVLVARCQATRARLAEEETRCEAEDQAFRHPLTTFSRFTRLANPEDFAKMHSHEKQRQLNDYFAVVLLQAYVRRKQERVRYCAARLRAKRTGRFIPVTSPATMAFAPTDSDHARISPVKAGFASDRITRMRAQYLGQLRAAQNATIGSSIRTPTAASSSSPTRSPPPMGMRDPVSPFRPQLPPRTNFR